MPQNAESKGQGLVGLGKAEVGKDKVGPQAALHLSHL